MNYSIVSTGNWKRNMRGIDYDGMLREKTNFIIKERLTDGFQRKRWLTGLANLLSR